MFSKRGQAYNVFQQHESPSENSFTAKKHAKRSVYFVWCYILSLEESLNY